MTEFVVVRHGSTDTLESRQWQGWSPVPLSVIGAQQARAVAGRLSKEGRIEAVLTSPLARARQTAQIIGEATGTLIVDCDDLKERMTATRLWGMAHADSLEYAAQARAHRLDPDWSYEDEEPWPALAARIARLAGLMQERIPIGSRFVLVTHGITLRLLTAAILAGIDAPLQDWLRVGDNLAAPECCSIAIFTGDASGIRLERWNDSQHLEPLKQATQG